MHTNTQKEGKQAYYATTTRSKKENGKKQNQGDDEQPHTQKRDTRILHEKFSSENLLDIRI